MAVLKFSRKITKNNIERKLIMMLEILTLTFPVNRTQKKQEKKISANKKKFSTAIQKEFEKKSATLKKQNQMKEYETILKEGRGEPRINIRIYYPTVIDKYTNTRL